MSNEQRRQCDWNTLQSLYSDHRCMCDMKKEIRGNLYATAGPAPLSSHNVMTLEKWSNKSLWKMIPPHISPMTWIVLMSLPSIPCSRLQSTLHPSFLQTWPREQSRANSILQMHRTHEVAKYFFFWHQEIEDAHPLARLHLTNDITGSVMRICLQSFSEPKHRHYQISGSNAELVPLSPLPLSVWLTAVSDESLSWPYSAGSHVTLSHRSLPQGSHRKSAFPGHLL